MRRMIGPGGDTGCLPAMTRKPGNPNWGHSIAPAPALATEFELRVRQLHLTQRCIPRRRNCVRGAGKTGTVSTSQNGCLRHGASR